MKAKRLFSILLCLTLLFACAPAQAKTKTFTLMIYLCGTDLESEGGAATDDLREMIQGGVQEGGNVTVYVQTGGTKSWQVNGLTDRKVERWTLTQEGLTLVDSVGAADMGDEETFADFLSYGFQNFPADRYGLVMWDHGSGASGGLCYDEMTQDALYYPEIYQALSTASKEDNYKKFAFIGFDACLMASYELAVHLYPFADYMIASEELEPGTGWNYAGWLPTLVKTPGAKVTTVGKAIVDSFISSALSYGSGDYATLSVCDLGKLPALQQAIEGMGSSLTGEIDSGNFSSISRLRQNMRSFGEVSDYSSDMIDLSVFASAFARFDDANATALKQALADVVVYEKHTSNLTNCTGLSILVPFATRGTASTYLSYYTQLGLSPGYSKFVTDMLQSAGSSAGDLLGTPSVSQQSIQSAQIDWFSQYADDQSSYQSSADSLWGDLYGSDYGESNASDFSLDDFLSTLFGSGESTYNTDYDDSVSSLWGDLGDDVDASFACDTGYGSGTVGSLWAGLQASATATPAATAEPTATQAPSLWDGLGISESSSAVNVQTSDAGEVTLQNPFADTQSDYAYTVELTQEQLQNLGKVEANLMMDVSDPDFECYVELGYVQDVVTDWNRGKIYGMFDGTWATLEGQMVCLYDQIANERYIRSLIPVTVNGDSYYLLVVFDSEHPTGNVIGYTEGYTDAGLPVRGYEELASGDVVVPQYELLYWDENSEQQSEPFEGDPITVGASGTLDFGYQAVESDASYAYGFCLTDIYGDYTYTDFITLEF